MIENNSIEKLSIENLLKRHRSEFVQNYQKFNREIGE